MRGWLRRRIVGLVQPSAVQVQAVGDIGIDRYLQICFVEGDLGVLSEVVEVEFPELFSHDAVEGIIARVEQFDTIGTVDDPEVEFELFELLFEAQAMSYFSVSDGLGISLSMEFRNQFKPGCEDRVVNHAQRKFSKEKHEFLEQDVQDMLELDVIEPCQSRFNSSPVVVPKPGKGAKFRSCIDYRDLNDLLLAINNKLPIIDDLVSCLGGGNNFYCTLDLAKGFWQIGIPEDERFMFAFSTRKGQWQYKRMPFGAKNAPAAFQDLMQRVLYPYLFETCFVYIDDVVVFGRSPLEVIQRCRDVLGAIRADNLKIGGKKCSFLVQRCEVLGHVVDRGRLYPKCKKLQGLRDMVSPTTRSQVKQVYGLLSFYRKFVKNFASRTRCISRQIRDDPEWTDECRRVVSEIVEEIISGGLRLPDFDQPMILTCDFSYSGIGGVLSQVQDSVEYPIAFCSRTLSRHEENYSPTEGEALAIVWCLKRFEYYVSCVQTIVRTDHRPLTLIKHGSLENRKLARWWLELQQYDLVFEYVEGRANLVADALSRLTHNTEPAEGLLSDVSEVLPDVPDEPLIQVLTRAQRQIASDRADRQFDEAYDTDVPSDSDDDPMDYHFVPPPVSSEQDDDPLFTPSGDVESAPSGDVEPGIGTGIAGGGTGIDEGGTGIDDLELHLSSPEGDDDVEFCPECGGAISLCDILDSSFCLQCDGGFVSEDAGVHYSGVALELLDPADPIQNLDLLLYITGKASKAQLIEKHGVGKFFVFAELATRFVAERGKLWRIYERGVREVPRVKFRNDIVYNLHVGAGHVGVTKLVAMLQSHFYWPRMFETVRSVVRSCVACQKQRREFRSMPLRPIVKGAAPFHAWNVDLLPALVPSSDGFRHVLLCVDPFSKWIELVPLRTKSSAEAWAAFYGNVILRYGAPYVVRCDRGLEFFGEFRTQCQRLRIDHAPISTQHPSANGQAERYVQVVKRAIKIVLQHESWQQTDWPACLPSILLGLRFYKQRVLGLSPYHVVFGVEPRVPQSEVLEPPVSDLVDVDIGDIEHHVDVLVSLVFEIHERVEQDLQVHDLKQKQAFDASLDEEFYEFSPGDKVLLKNRRQGALESLLVGPFVFVRYKDPARYAAILRDENGKEFDCAVTHLVPLVEAHGQ